MKKVVVVIVLVVAVLIVAGILAKKEAESMQDRFFAVVAAGDPAALIELMGSDLPEELEPPVLAAWMAGINKGLGAYEGLVEGEWTVRNETFEGRECRLAEGRARFAKGEALVRVVHENDRLVGFRIDAAEETDGWWEAIDTTPYRKQAQQFLRHLLERDVAKARETAGAIFQAETTAEEIQGLLDRLLAEAGDLQEVTFLRSRWVPQESGRVALELDWDVRMTGWRHEVMVQFLFPAFHGRISAVNLLHGG